MNPIHSVQDLDRIRRAASAYAVIAAWEKAGLFSVLQDGMTRRADEFPADPRAIATTAPILAHLGLLCTDGEAWSLSATGQEFLEGGHLSLTSAEQALGDLSRLDRVLVEGGPVHDQSGASKGTDIGVRDDAPDDTRAFMNMLYRRSERSAQYCAKTLVDELPCGAHILDLGGGHGRYADELKKKGFEITVYDKAVCVELARERFGKRFRYMAGDFMSDDLGGPYDAIFLSNIVHGLGPETCALLFARLYNALVPGGSLVIKDMFIDDMGSNPEQPVFFGLTMLMYTEEGLSYNLRDMYQMFGDTGYEVPLHLWSPDQGFSILLANTSETV
jgi:SAM-dependent methyltransferase